MKLSGKKYVSFFMLITFPKRIDFSEEENYKL